MGNDELCYCGRRLQLLLGLAGYFGLPRLIEEKVGEFLKEKGATESLQKLAATMAVAEEKKDSIKLELRRAQNASTQLQTLAAESSHLIGFLETKATGEYPTEPAGWRWVPYQDSKQLQIAIRIGSPSVVFQSFIDEYLTRKSVKPVRIPPFRRSDLFKVFPIRDTSDMFLVTFAYRVKGSADGLKFSRVNVKSKSGQSFKTIEAIGATLKSTDFGASGSVIVASLQKGDYTIVVEDYDSQPSYRKYESGRQLCVYKLR